MLVGRICETTSRPSMFEFLHHGQFSFIATRPATLATRYRTISSTNMNFDSYFIEIDRHISDFIYKKLHNSL
ncbi:hypothetical protein DXT98_03025 [Agrobacterium sp. ICMP 7243]|nr:hypothetical protein DXT98_03025 [Agrobacterium sp. ICMP 7243]OCJ25140.1 hypothetical protein A6U88_01285 [Agrobacterium sp. B131/95]